MVEPRSGLVALVNDWKDHWMTGKHVKTVYNETAVGQQYACLVTSGVWYKVRLIMEDEYRSRVPPTGTVDKIVCGLTGETEHFTMSGVDEQIDKYRRWFDRLPGSFKEIYDQHLKGTLWRTLRDLPRDWGSNPDTYIKRGDVVQCHFIGQFHHTAVYLGREKVAHMSGHGDGKGAAKVRIGDLVPHFVARRSDKVQVVIFRIRVRKAEQIAATAERYAAENFRDGEYNLLMRNCQHFATLCALGVELSIDMEGAAGFW